MLDKIALMTLIFIMVILLSTSVVVIAKGPTKKIDQGSNVKSFRGHITLVEKNPSKWLSSWLGQK